MSTSLTVKRDTYTLSCHVKPFSRQYGPMNWIPKLRIPTAGMWNILPTQFVKGEFLIRSSHVDRKIKFLDPQPTSTGRSFKNMAG